MLLEARVEHPTTEAEAVRIAHELYGLDASARALPGEYDDNFQLTATNGRSYVLKVMHPARERAFIDLQCQALRHLAQWAPQLALPRVIPNRSGQLFTSPAGADGSNRLVWLLTFVAGATLAEARPHPPDLLHDLGHFLGEMDAALQSFTHPAAHRELKWDSSRVLWIKDYIKEIADPKRRALVEKFLALYESEVAPALPRLRRGVIYGDANDHNVLVSPPWPQPRKVASVIDFGDIHHGLTASEPAIAAAYAVLGKENPLEAAASLVSGYHAAFPLDEHELSVLYALICARLAVSVTNSAHRKTLKPDDSYVTVSEAPAWEAVERLAKIHPRFAHYTFRAACGFPPVPQSQAVEQWLRVIAGSSASILDINLRTAPSIVFDLSVGSAFLGADPASAETLALTEKVFSDMKDAGVTVGVGRYNEPRLLYTSPLFGPGDDRTQERPTVHLGIDLFVEPGTPLRAPLDGVVHIVANNAAPLDYGPLVVLRHETGSGEGFFALYGHLTKDTLQGLKVGQHIASGQSFARVGSAQENGGWTPHLHFQIILDLLEFGADFPGVAYASQRSVWTSLSPDPNLLLGIPAERFPEQEPEFEETLAQRRALLGKNLSISYQRSLKIVRVWMQ
jgi:Ser/Thr protein kinase RdoA (MazF antagonist)